MNLLLSVTVDDTVDIHAHNSCIVYVHFHVIKFTHVHTTHTKLCTWVSHTQEGRKEMFYLTTHSTHFIYGYMASDILLRTILIVRKKTRCRHLGYSFRLTARVLLYAPSHRQDSTYHSLCYTSCGALAGTRNSSMAHTQRHNTTYMTHNTMYVTHNNVYDIHITMYMTHTAQCI